MNSKAAVFLGCAILIAAWLITSSGRDSADSRQPVASRPAPRQSARAPGKPSSLVANISGMALSGQIKRELYAAAEGAELPSMAGLSSQDALAALLRRGRAVGRLAGALREQANALELIPAQGMSTGLRTRTSELRQSMLAMAEACDRLSASVSSIYQAGARGGRLSALLGAPEFVEAEARVDATTRAYDNALTAFDALLLSEGQLLKRMGCPPNC